MADTVHVGAAPGDADALCIVIHGRGQTQNDMLEAIVNRLDVPGVRFALPKSGDVGWYTARAIDPLTDRTRAELDHAMDVIAALIADETRQMPGRPVMLCGFSQGACVAIELLARDAALADAACLLTGCRVGEGVSPLPPLAGLPVYASCGDDDPWIPLPAYHRMLEALAGTGARLRADVFPGRPHMVNDTEIAVLAGMLRALCTGRPGFGDGA